jgi:hypothetical protein
MITNETQEDPDYFILSQLIKREEELIEENKGSIDKSFGKTAEYYIIKGRLLELNRFIKLIKISQKWNTSITPKHTLRLHAFYSAIDNLYRGYIYKK